MASLGRLLTLGVAATLVCYIVVLTVLLAALGRKHVDMPTCAKCGYSLHGLADDIRCPECGERYQGPATARRHDE
jgi:ribosomal protein L34E